MKIIKQSTSPTVKMGPFIFSADGATPITTGLTITSADVRVSKNGGNFAAKNDGAAASHDEFGYYDVDFDTTDTGTLGRLRVAVAGASALPVWNDFMIMNTQVFESFFGTDTLEVDITDVNGSAVVIGDFRATVTSATNLSEVDITGQSVSAFNLSEVDVTGQSVNASATNLSEVDITGQSVSAFNLSEVDITGQSVSAFNLSEVDITGQSVNASATNLSEVDITGQSVSAFNLSEVDITGQSVNASATNLSEVDVTGQSVSAFNLSEVDITGQSVSAFNLGDINLTGQSVSAFNLSEVDVTGQSVSAFNLGDINLTGQSVSAFNLSEVDITGQSVSAFNLDEIDFSSLATSAALAVVDGNVDAIVAKLPLTGLIAGKDDIEAILLNTRFKASVPSVVIIPESGFVMYKIVAHLYDVSGSMEDPDDDILAIQIRAINGEVYKNLMFEDFAGTTPATSATLFSPEYYEMAKESTGYYSLFYQLSASEPPDQWVATFAYNELSASQFHTRTTTFVDENPGAAVLADSSVNKQIIRDSMGFALVGSQVAGSVDTKLDSIQTDLDDPDQYKATSVSAFNLSEVDVTGQSVSAFNLSEVDVTGQSVNASATNLDEVDITGQSVSAFNLSEVDVTGQSVNASATNLDEVDVTGQSVSAFNLSEVDITGQFVNASATNLDEVDVTGQSVSAFNLDEIDFSSLATSAQFASINVSADTTIALTEFGVETSAHADINKDEIIGEINTIVGNILSASIDGSVSVSATLYRALSYVTGRIDYLSGTDEFIYFSEDNSTSAFGLSGTLESRTRF
jgi:uncharacterized protein YjbI with pentapeptide repeats